MSPTVSEYPFVSVIMPIRNEADFIERSLGSVLRSDYPVDKLEVLVADGCSDDGTQDVVDRMSKSDNRVHLLNNTGKIVSTGLNLALKEMRGDIFIRVDGHCEIPNHFIKKSVETLLEKTDAWVAGGYWKTVSTGYIGKVISAATETPFGVGNARHRLGNFDGWVDTLPYGAHHRWLLRRIGYFDEQLVRNQDDEFNMRIRLAGGKIWMSSEIWSTYFSRSSLKKLWRQYFQYGFWRIRTLQKHKIPATVRQVVPLAFVASLLIMAVLSFIFPPVVWGLAGFLVMYFAGVCLGTFAVVKRVGWTGIFAAPLVFMILHFGYGLGSLWGFVRFVVLHGLGLPKPEDCSISR